MSQAVGAGASGDGARASGPMGEFESFGAIEDATADGAFGSITSYDGDIPLATLVPFKRPISLVEVGTDEPVRLSRFAYLHRSGHRMLLKTPLTGVDLELHDPRVGAIVTALAFDASAASLATRVGLSPDAAVIVVRQMVSMSAANVVGPARAQVPQAVGLADGLAANLELVQPSVLDLSANRAVSELTVVLGAPVRLDVTSSTEASAALTPLARATFDVATPAHLAAASMVLERYGVPASVIARLPLLTPAVREPSAMRLVIEAEGEQITGTIAFELRRAGPGVQDAVPGVLDVLGLMPLDGEVRLTFDPDGAASATAPPGTLSDADATHIRRTAEDSDVPSTWEFHDLLFHSQSRVGRVRHQLGGTARFSVVPDTMHPILPPAPGDLPLPVLDAAAAVRSDPPFGEVLRSRVSHRDWTGPALTLAQLSELLQRVAEVLQRTGDLGGMEMEYTGAPYPSGGALYETDIVVLTNRVDGLTRGAYLYQRLSRSLTPLHGDLAKLDALLAAAADACAQGVQAPQALLVLAARFPDLAVKYEGVAYALMLKHVGVLMATIAYTATAMGLGTTPIGVGNSDDFAAATGLDYYRHGSIGEIALTTLPSAGAHGLDLR